VNFLTIPRRTKVRPSHDEALRAAGRRASSAPVDWDLLAGDELVDALSRDLGEASDRLSYLVLALLHRRIPAVSRVVEFTRRWRVEGLSAPLTEEYRRGSVVHGAARPFVIVDTVVMDVTDTSRSSFTTGIQRVARETVTRWTRDHRVLLAAWDVTGRHLAALTDHETGRVLLEGAGEVETVAAGTVIVPFDATFVLPEITVAAERTASVRSVVRFGTRRAVAIGYDCIPVTTAETSGPGMPGAFSEYLATLSTFDAIAPISSAAFTEYTGWSAMLPGAGLVPPHIETVSLPAQVGAVDDDVVERVRSELGLVGATVVLSVGSHEPRKNHLALLTAAELNWRAGHDFTLVLVGGNAWGDGEFQEMVRRLRRKGRSVQMLSGVGDDVVWSLYRMARFSVFCSVNEGFGLPVVESLVSGVPVVTSDFGSMRELGEGHGALVVDPHSPLEMSRAMGRLFSDDELHVELVAQSADMPRPTWDDYAADLWRLVAGE
jgi:hypothetical protein